jgi:hypothetical protein
MTIKGGKPLIENKGLGGKRINRYNISLSNHYDKKLNQFAMACNKVKKPTTLAALLVEFCLDNPEIVDLFQKEYSSAGSPYKVVPFKKHDRAEVEYLVKLN